MSRSWVWEMRLLAVIIVLIITIINTSAEPLEVNIVEKVASTIEVTGVGNDGTATFSYNTNTTGFISITNNGTDDIYDVWVAVKLENNATPCTLLFENASSSVSVGSLTVPDRINKYGVFNTSDANCFIHIPHLRPGQLVIVEYDVNDTSMGIDDGAPFIVSERYDPAKIPEGGEYNWTVYLNVSLNGTWWSNTAVGTTPSVTLNIVKVLNKSDTNWARLEVIDNSWKILSGSGSASGNAYSVTFSGITLDSSNSVNTSFEVLGNYSTDEAFATRLVLFGDAYFDFTLSSGNISGTKILDVFATGDMSIAVNKSGPHSGNKWIGNATINNTASGLVYVLTNVTVWATDRDYKTIVNAINTTSPGYTLNPKESWKSGDLSFTYSSVPIIWANATFKLVKGDGGWQSYDSVLNNSGFIVIEKIYVIGSYLVKVTKYVRANASAGENVFDVKLVVENLGGNESPYVYVYDMLPEKFNEFNWDDRWNDTGDGNWVNKPEMFAGNGTETGLSISGYSKGFWWRLKPLKPGADGDGIASEDELDNYRAVEIFYQMNGTGDFKVLDAFIVGIDPMLSMNEQTSPRITIVSGSASTSYESIMILATALAGLVAVVTYRKRS